MNEECEFQSICDNYNPHRKSKNCLDDQCPMNDYDNFKKSVGLEEGIKMFNLIKKE